MPAVRGREEMKAGGVRRDMRRIISSGKYLNAGNPLALKNTQNSKVPPGRKD